MRVVVDDRPRRVVGDALDDLRPGAPAAGERDKCVPRRMEGLALDAGLAACPRPEVRPGLLGVVHELVNAPVFAPGDNEISWVGISAVR